MADTKAMETEHSPLELDDKVSQSSVTTSRKRKKSPWILGGLVAIALAVGGCMTIPQLSIDKERESRKPVTAAIAQDVEENVTSNHETKLLKIQPDAQSRDEYVQAVHDVMRRCFETVTETVISKAALTGGYFVKHEPHTSFGTPYYLFSRKKYVPELNHIERNIEGLVEQLVPFCVDYINSNGGDIASESSPKVDLIFYQDKVDIRMGYKIKVRHKGMEDFIQNFSTSISSPFLEMYNLALAIINTSFNTNRGYCMGCTVQSNLNGFEVQSVSSAEGYHFVLKSYQEDNENITIFKFAVKP